MRALALLLSAVFMVACGDRLPAAKEADPSAIAGAWALRSAGPVPIVPAIAYVVTPDTTTQNSPVFVRAAGGPDVRIGDGIVVTGDADVLLVSRLDGHQLAFWVGDQTRLFSDRNVQGGPKHTFVHGGMLFEYSNSELAAIDESGAVSGVPIPSAIPTTVGPCQLQKGSYDLRASGLWAVASAGGHLFAYVATLGNGAVVDLDGGRHLDLIDAGYSLGMVLGADGKLYALTVDGRCPPSRLLVRRIDPATMKEEAVIDTGRTLPVAAVGLVSAIGGGVYVHLVTDTAAELLRVERAGVSSTRLPSDSGLRAVSAPDGTIYLFGGRARNVVTRVDPASGASVSVDAATAPPGSFIGALFFR